MCECVCVCERERLSERLCVKVHGNKCVGSYFDHVALSIVAAPTRACVRVSAYVCMCVCFCVCLCLCVRDRERDSAGICVQDDRQ